MSRVERGVFKIFIWIGFAMGDMTYVLNLRRNILSILPNNLYGCKLGDEAVGGIMKITHGKCSR